MLVVQNLKSIFFLIILSDLKLGTHGVLCISIKSPSLTKKDTQFLLKT